MVNERSVYRDVNSGGSFGSNPLEQHIGIGQATVIDSIEIKWPVTGKVQVFKKMPVDVHIKMKEGNDLFLPIHSHVLTLLHSIPAW